MSKIQRTPEGKLAKPAPLYELLPTCTTCSTFELQFVNSDFNGTLRSATRLTRSGDRWWPVEWRKVPRGWWNPAAEHTMAATKRRRCTRGALHQTEYAISCVLLALGSSCSRLSQPLLKPERSSGYCAPARERQAADRGRQPRSLFLLLLISFYGPAPLYRHCTPSHRVVPPTLFVWPPQISRLLCLSPSFVYPSISDSDSCGFSRCVYQRNSRRNSWPPLRCS